MIDLDLSRQKLQGSLSYLSICNSLKIHQRLMENTTWNQDESDKELRSQIENEIKVEKEILQKNYRFFDKSQPEELIKSLIKMYTYMIIARDIYYCQSDINYMRCYLDDYKIDTFNELLCQFEGKRIIKGDGEYQTLKLFSAYLIASIVQYMRNTSYTFSSDFLVADIAFFDTIESMAANIFIENWNIDRV